MTNTQKKIRVLSLFSFLIELSNNRLQEEKQKEGKRLD